MATDCVTCGGPKVEMLPEHEEIDECRSCELDRPKTLTYDVIYPCDECGTEYRGPKFARECCTATGDKSDQ